MARLFNLHHYKDLTAYGKLSSKKFLLFAFIAFSFLPKKVFIPINKTIKTNDPTNTLILSKIPLLKKEYTS